MKIEIWLIWSKHIKINCMNFDTGDIVLYRHIVVDDNWTIFQWQYLESVNQVKRLWKERFKDVNKIADDFKHVNFIPSSLFKF